MKLIIHTFFSSRCLLVPSLELLYLIIIARDFFQYIFGLLHLFLELWQKLPIVLLKLLLVNNLFLVHLVGECPPTGKKDYMTIYLFSRQCWQLQAPSGRSFMHCEARGCREKGGRVRAGSDDCTFCRSISLSIAQRLSEAGVRFFLCLVCSALKFCFFAQVSD